MSAHRKVTIVVLTWNGLGYTRRCLDSLARTRHPAFEVIVADNGSTDGTLEHLRARSDIRLIENGANLGYAGGNNPAIRAADPASDVVLLNNDTEITDPDWLLAMQATALSAPDVGMVGCRLADPAGRLHHVGTYLALDDLSGHQLGADQTDVGQYGFDREVEGVVFACVYLRRPLLDAIGLLDEDYFAYFEDTDYCLKAKAAGFRILCSGGATVRHFENTSGKLNALELGRLFQKSRATFQAKWGAHLAATRYPRRLGWHGAFNLPGETAAAARGLATALDRAGVRLGYRYLHDGDPGFPAADPARTDRPVLAQVMARPLDLGAPTLSFGAAEHFVPVDGQGPRFGYTTAEADRVPSGWVQRLNRLDLVWVPGEDVRAALLESGVRVPVEVLPLGFDPGPFNPRVLGRPNPDFFTFVAGFEWDARAGAEILFKAFNDEFGSAEPVRLVVQAWRRLDPAGGQSGPPVDPRREVLDWRLSGTGGRILLSVDEPVPAAQRGAFWRSGDAFVSTARGPGWDAAALEAAACGLPVIAPPIGRDSGWLTPELGYPLAPAGRVPADPSERARAGFLWAEPSYEDCRRTLRLVFEGRAAARAKGEAAARQVLETLSWDMVAKRMLRRLDELAGNAAT